MKQYIPILLQAFWKLLRDPAFKDMVWAVAEVEGRWLFGDLNKEAAWREVSGLLYDYFFKD